MVRVRDEAVLQELASQLLGSSLTGGSSCLSVEAVRYVGNELRCGGYVWMSRRLGVTTRRSSASSAIDSEWCDAPAQLLLLWCAFLCFGMGFSNLNVGKAKD